MIPQAKVLTHVCSAGKKNIILLTELIFREYMKI